MSSMTDGERDVFLARARLGILTTLRSDGSPVGTPVWFEWDGKAVRVFTSARSAKVRRLERDPRASLVVVNSLDEPEAWVAFDGSVSISSDGAFDLAERLAHRYWDMADAGHQASVESWRRAAASLRVLELRPERVRSSNG